MIGQADLPNSAIAEVFNCEARILTVSGETSLWANPSHGGLGQPLFFALDASGSNGSQFGGPRCIRYG